ncbi:hypothetical protein ScPMuIL_013100 [Solemya velum]
MSTEIEWRRRWKPNLDACPWQTLFIDGKTYLIKMKFTQYSYEILLTDFTSFWFEELSDNALKKRIQKLNPSIEAPITRILDQIKNCLEEQDRETEISTAFKPDGDGDDEKILLSIKSELAGMPFSWHFTGRPAEKSMMSEHLIVPLMAMVGELMRRQAELITIIQSKDKEIDDYKSQGVRTSRKHIETNPFVETAFENDMLLSKGFEQGVRQLGSTAFTESGQDLYRQLMSKSAWLSRSPRKDDDDGDSLLDDSSLSQRRKPSTGPSWENSRLPPSMTDSKSNSPQKSPGKSPGKSPKASPVKTSEMLRQKALERRMEQEELKKQEKTKKKKKIAF